MKCHRAGDRVADPAPHRSPPLRILAYTHRFDFTGAPLILYRLIRALAPRHEISLLLPRHDRTEGPLRAAFDALGVRCLPTGRAEDFDVLLANTLVGWTVVANLIGRLPILWWVHEPRDGLLRLRARNVEAETFHGASLVVFPTRWQAETLYAPFLGRTPWRVVPYGIGLDPYEGPPPAAFPGDRIELVHLGYLAQRKGQDVSLRALELLDDPRLHLTLMGADDIVPGFAERLRSWLSDRPRLARRVTLLGSQPPEIAMSYVAHADALLFPTRDDLITLTILEAMLHGTCVVASDFGPIPETVIDDRTGLLHRTGDAVGLARAIARVRDEPGLKTRLGAAGREIYERKHGFAAHVAAMEGALHEACALGPARRERGRALVRPAAPPPAA